MQVLLLLMKWQRKRPGAVKPRAFLPSGLYCYQAVARFTAQVTAFSEAVTMFG